MFKSKPMIALIIFAFIPASLVALDGYLGDGVCVQQFRIVDKIELSNGPTARPRFVPREVCCNGYQNISNVCTPICNPECVFGSCMKPNQCQCHDGFEGTICDDIKTHCEDGFWDINCDQECNCNGSNCTITEGKCLCQAGFSGERCELPCNETHYGPNCKLTCDCQNGTCNGITGICTCHRGFTGINCSMECPKGKYGLNCAETCKCENDAICNKITGSCQCKDGFQGTYCENTCRVGYWGEDCREVCKCNKTENCDPKNGNCFCANGFTGEQCTKACEPGFCGFQCSEKCSCVSGTCSTSNCTCDCHPMMHGTDCSESCNCNKNNTEKCNPISGKCICKPGWTGTTCNERCPDKFYGYNCDKECTCTWDNTLLCEEGICKCKDGFLGENCDNICELGYYGSNCTKICFHFGLENYICHHVLGERCSPLYTGENCETCKCGKHGSCLRDKCDCNAGYHGKLCDMRCPINKYGKNCESTCNCGSCRDTDGFCKCQDGFQGEKCSDYCPNDFYDHKNDLCLNPVEDTSLSNELILYGITGSISMLILLVVLVIFICYICRKKNQDKSYGMVNLRAPKIALPNPNTERQRSVNNYVRDEPVYETISDTRLSSYQGLVRSDEIPSHTLEPNYFHGYERPRYIPQHIEMYGSYTALDRNSIGPH